MKLPILQNKNKKLFVWYEICTGRNNCSDRRRKDEKRKKRHDTNQRQINRVVRTEVCDSRRRSKAALQRQLVEMRRGNVVF